MKMDALRALAWEAAKLPLEAATSRDRAHGATSPAMIPAVRDGVAVHPDSGERIRVSADTDHWSAGLLCRVRDAVTLALFGLTEERGGHLPAPASSERGQERWRL